MSPRRVFYFILGSVFLVIGIIGVFLPILPTTPFLLVTATCYAKSSQRFYLWLLNHPMFGSYISAWEQERRIPRKAKLTAFFMICLSMGYATLFIAKTVVLKLVLVATAIGVIVYIRTFPD